MITTNRLLTSERIENGLFAFGRLLITSIGAREYEQARFYTIKLMKISYICTAVIGTATCILLPNILSFYKLSSETNSLCFSLIVIHNLLVITLHPTSFHLPNSLRAAGDVRFTLYVGVGSMVIFRIGTAVLLGIVLNLGIIGVWIAMGMDWTVCSFYHSFQKREMESVSSNISYKIKGENNYGISQAATWH